MPGLRPLQGRFVCCRWVFEYLDFADSIVNLKEFLKLRDSHPVFDQVRSAGSIGIPCIVKENGEVTLSWEEFM